MKTTEIAEHPRDSEEYIKRLVYAFEEKQRKAGRKAFKLPGAYEKWHGVICGGNRTCAGILNYLLTLHHVRRENETNPVLKFTSEDLVVQVFRGDRTRKTVGLGLVTLSNLGLITVTREGRKKLKGKYPDHTAHITINAEVVNQKRRDFEEGKPNTGASDVSPKSEDKVWGSVTPEGSAHFSGAEKAVQQVQTPTDAPESLWGSVTPPSVSASVSFIPTLSEIPENPIPEETPSKATGTPIKKFSKRNARTNTWVNPWHGEPVPEGDDVIKEFSRNHWCMALVHLFRLPDVTHKQAREFMTAIAKDEIGVREMLWLQVTIFPRILRRKSLTDLSLPKLREMAAELNARYDTGYRQVEESEFQFMLNAYLFRAIDEESTAREFSRVAAEMTRARNTPLEQEKMEDVMNWAGTWAGHISNEDWGKMQMGQNDFLIIRPEYPEVAEDGHEDPQSVAPPEIMAPAPDTPPAAADLAARDKAVADVKAYKEAMHKTKPPVRSNLDPLPFDGRVWFDGDKEIDLAIDDL